MKQIEMGIIGVGWIGEIDKARLERVAKETGARTSTSDYHELLARTDLDAIIVSTTPETTHYPFTRDCLMARKHVLLEKPIGLELKHADELTHLARAHRLKLTIGYTQRFNPKYAYVKQCVVDGTIGQPVTALVSRN